MRRIFMFAAAAVVLAAVCAGAEDPNPPSIHSTRGAWPLYRQWNQAETKHYARWINHIYRMKRDGNRDQWLAKLERVLTDPEMNLLLHESFASDTVNPQLGLDTVRAMHSVLDCGKLTVALGAYYAYRRGLPWMQCYVRCGGGGGDLRTAAYTVPVGCISSFEYSSASQFFIDAVTGMCTGNFRVEMGRLNSELSDTVPAAIDPKYLMPGCLFYLDGHVLILAEIDKYGDVFFLDATVSPTRDIYIHNGFNAVTGISARNGGPEPYAGCYRGFRIERYPIAETDAEGKVIKVRRRTDDEMKEFGFSTEQYDKLGELMQHRAIVEYAEARELAMDNFHDFVRFRMRTADKMDPASDLDRFVGVMMQLMKEREAGVQAAWQDVQANGPIEFPETRNHTNIFNAGGRWGLHSSSVLDLTMRMKYFALLNWLDSTVAWFDWMPEYVTLERLNKDAVWTRDDLIYAITRHKNRVFSRATFTYRNSKGDDVQLTLADIEKRLFALSFDPNQPPELRWGAADGSDEAEFAREMPTLLPGGSLMPMTEAYQRQAYYRNLTERDVEPTAIRGMFTEGFPVRDTGDAHLALSYRRIPSPCLVPVNGVVEWLKENPAGLPGRTPTWIRPGNN